MQTKHTRLHKTLLATAVATAIGTLTVPLTANADIYVWGATNPDLTGATTASVLPPALADYTTICSNSPNAATVTFTMLDSTGAALANSSVAKGSNQYQTITCGTLTYDTSTQSGSATIAPFAFFGSSYPALATGILVNKIPAGLDNGSGNLMMANMLFDWGGNSGIPVSLVWDAQGILGEMNGSPTSFTLNSDGTIASASAFSNSGGIPASDGTYNSAIPVNGGYLNLGPQPLATLSFNTANVSGVDSSGNTVCVPGADGVYTDNTGGGCMNVNPSADITKAIITDTATNNNDYNLTTPTTGDLANDGIGGNPMVDGPFTGFNANFEFNNMKLVSFTDTTPPVITLNGSNPQSVTLGSGAYSDPGATCTDAAPLNTNLNGSVVANSSSVDTATGGVYTVTYNCSDPSGNNATQVTRTVVVASPGAPLIALSGNNPDTFECNPSGSYTDPGALCVDYEDGQITGTDTPVTGDLFSIDSSNVNANVGTPGAYSSVTSCTDSSANTVTAIRTVNVADTTPPVITINGSSTVNIVSTTAENPATYTDAGASATDGCDLSSIGVTTTNPVNMVVPDTGSATLTYQVQYDAVDASLNPALAKIRTVNVTRSQPVITLVGSGNIVLSKGSTYVESGMDVTDAQDGSVTNITADGACLGGTSVCTISGTVDTNTNGNYTITYNVTDNDGNKATTVTRKVTVGAFAQHSNFTMLDAKGKVFGGTNDVVFDWPDASAVLGGDLSSLNSDTSNYANDLKFNMTIASAGPQPFFGAPWYAHDVRLFGPGTYSFDSGCTVAELEATGCPAGSAANSGPTITMTVATGQIGAHMLFDYNGTANIDVINVWDINGVWNDPDGTSSPVNDLWTGDRIDSSDGLPPDPAGTWTLVSRDVNGDGINGTPMVDGPFVNFYANFNAGGSTAAITCTPPATLDTATGSCIITSDIVVKDKLKNNFLGSMTWTTLLGLLPVFGLLRRRKIRR